MGRIVVVGLAATLLAVTTFLLWPQNTADPVVTAEGPVTADHGAAVFGRYCTTCHVITAPDGTVLAGDRSRAGPNLYGIVGAQAGSVPGFRYSSALITAGTDHDLIWTPEHLAEYVRNPSGFLQTFTQDDSLRSRMSFRLRTPTADTDAQAIAVYLAQITGTQ